MYEANNLKTNYYQIREFVVNYIFIWNEIRGPGHFLAIKDIFKNLIIENIIITDNKITENFIEYGFTYYYIIEYLSKILEKYTNNGKLNLMKYFDEVFLKNIDIWGFTMIYLVFYEYLFESSNKLNKLNKYHQFFMDKIKYIIIHFLYENSTNIIDVSSLVNELTNLNKIIEKFEIVDTLSRDNYVLKFKNDVLNLIKNKKTHKIINKTNKTKKRR